MTHRRKIVVTGSEGQLLRCLLERSRSLLDVEVVSLGRPQLDLADLARISGALIDARPDAIVSVAAYTAVDKAEHDRDEAHRVNGDAPAEIAKAAAELGIPMVHISTDYVFDGQKGIAYTEEDRTNPTGVYGHSKLLGEHAVAEHTKDYAILRTAWVYSPFGRNFLLTMLRLAETQSVVRVVDDQVGNPTCALDLSDSILGVVRNLLSSEAPELRGVFHAAGTGITSWADFASYIFDISKECGGPYADVVKIPSSDFPTLARRPPNSALDCTKLEASHGVRLPFWKKSTEEVIRRLLST
ncbi:dTDP-4-dehydrorhamnose reductase [Ensifer sp. ENS03]|uniref:dTDP-4-dehydrorhamnose reductase n=1 Tax=Ensifer sp. ENS03 TaxID=2769283 RepID=UPI00177CD2A5|nr:dTDP-4-dehydrorhamnose reductase [Ensifer sp. ENS03]MBD9559600.1 dTDP-4-dehydrorhamnose reductase [Ensifer sp. ENS03]